jgi:hypothetical protein
MMGSEDTKMVIKGSAGKREHKTLMSPQKLEIITKLESGES